MRAMHPCRTYHLEMLMAMSRRVIVGGALVVMFGALAVGQEVLRADASQTVEAPRFEVDPFWPRPMPNNWVLGSVI